MSTRRLLSDAQVRYWTGSLYALAQTQLVELIIKTARGYIVCDTTLILDVSSLKGRDMSYSIADNTGECSLPVRR
jgi:hypothetical protein